MGIFSVTSKLVNTLHPNNGGHKSKSLFKKAVLLFCLMLLRITAMKKLTVKEPVYPESLHCKYYVLSFSLYFGYPCLDLYPRHADEL